jgi:hypothetical protein
MQKPVKPALVTWLASLGIYVSADGGCVVAPNGPRSDDRIRKTPSGSVRPAPRPGV